jgi:hypothetical protein
VHAATTETRATYSDVSSSHRLQMRRLSSPPLLGNGGGSVALKDRNNSDTRGDAPRKYLLQRTVESAAHPKQVKKRVCFFASSIRDAAANDTDSDSNIWKDCDDTHNRGQRGVDIANGDKKYNCRACTYVSLSALYRIPSWHFLCGHAH